MSDAQEVREEGFYWVIIGQNPPEIAYWERGEWWWRRSALSGRGGGGVMQAILWVSAPIVAVAAVATATMVIAWAHGANICDTWLSVILPLCR